MLLETVKMYRNHSNMEVVYDCDGPWVLKTRKIFQNQHTHTVLLLVNTNIKFHMRSMCFLGHLSRFFVD